MATARRSRFDFRFAALMLAAALTAALAFSSAPAAAAEDQGEARLDRIIQDALREGGPFFEADERAVIERKCGYAPGSWDGFDVNVSNGIFICNNGRHLDDPEMRAIMARAEPRIQQRVHTVMHRPEIEAAISEVARHAAAEAMRELAQRHDN